MTDRTKLDGTVALVTGATGGIGRATVAALRDRGASVIATDMAKSAEVEGATTYLPLDVTSEAAWADVVARIEAEHDRLDILVNNAGISVTNSVAASSLAEFRRCMAVNVEGVFLGTRAAQPLMTRSGAAREGGSSIINLSSVGGLRGAPFMATYCASKGAVKLFSKSAALEFAALKLPIRVNSVHPGGIETDMMDTIFARYVDEGLFPDMDAARAAVSAGHAVSRMGQPREIAEGIAFLASPAASFMTGSELVIDGGMTAK